MFSTDRPGFSADLYENSYANSWEIRSRRYSIFFNQSSCDYCSFYLFIYFIYLLLLFFFCKALLVDFLLPQHVYRPLTETKMTM